MSSMIYVCGIFLFLYTAAGYVPNVKPIRQVVNFPKEANERIRAVVEQCIQSDDKVTEFLKLVREGKYREDQEFQNYVHCSYKYSGYAREDGTVKIELASSVYPDPAAMLKVMKKCDKMRGITPVDNTFLFFKCFQDNSPFLIGLGEGK